MYTTEYQFPGILRWFPVVDSEVVSITYTQSSYMYIMHNIIKMYTLGGYTVHMTPDTTIINLYICMYM